MATPVSNMWLTQAYYQETPDALWRLDDMTGAGASDLTTNNYNGTVVGGVTTGQSGWTSDGDSAMLFDGSTGYISVGNFLAYQARFSVMAAFKAASATTIRVLISKCLQNLNGWSLSLTAAHKLRFAVYSSANTAVVDISSATSYDDGNWHFVTAVFDTVNLTAKIIVDGTTDGTGSISTTLLPDSNSARLLIGAQEGATPGSTQQSYFGGTLDEVGLYPYALTTTQETALYAARTSNINIKSVMQSRSAVSRSGAARSNYYTIRPIALLNGVDLMLPTNTQYGIRRGTLQATDILNEQADTARFTMWDRSGTVTPAPGMSLILADGASNNRYFGGTVVRATYKSVTTPGGRVSALPMYDVEATDWTWLLNRRTVTVQYAAGQSASLVVLSLVQNYSTGFTTNNVQPLAPTLIAPLTFKGIKLGAAISQVCQSVVPNWNYYPDSNQDIHFFLTETQQRPQAFVPGLMTYNSLVHTFDLTQIRTRMLGEGGGSGTTAAVPIGSTSIPVTDCSWYSPTGGTVVSTGQTILITYTGTTAAAGPGSLTGVPSSGAGSVSVSLLLGDTLDVWVQTDDLPAQAALALLEGGDGIHEQYLSTSGGDTGGSSGGTIVQCQQANLAELAKYKTQLVQGTLWSIDKQMRSGKTLTIALPAARNINIDVTIQQVQRSLWMKNKWQFNVTYGTLWRNVVDMLKRAGVTQ